MNEKINGLNEILDSEKETRENWIERYKKEQENYNKEHALLLQAKKDHNDELFKFNALDNLNKTTVRQNEQMLIQNKKFQATILDLTRKNDDLSRNMLV